MILILKKKFDSESGKRIDDDLMPITKEPLVAERKKLQEQIDNIDLLLADVEKLERENPNHVK